jgi:hypothetical protein
VRLFDEAVDVLLELVGRPERWRGKLKRRGYGAAHA